MAEPVKKEGVRQEEDRIDSRRMLVVGAVALCTFAVGIYWAVTIQKTQEGGIRSVHSAPAPLAGQREVGMVYQTPFAEPTIAGDLATRKRKVLHSYGWVDSEHTTGRIPIERAMELLVTRAAQP